MTIYETPVYCGRLKVWRVLNLMSGTIYSMEFESFDEALKSIKEGEDRGGMVVKAIEVPDICTILDKHFLS